MSYLTDSYIVFTLKMESVSKDTIFGLKMTVKSGLEKCFLNSSKRQPFSITIIYLIERRSFDQKYKFGIKNDMVSAWRNLKNILVSDSFKKQRKFPRFLSLPLQNGWQKKKWNIFSMLNSS